MNGLDCAKCQKSRQNDKMRIIGMFNDNKTRMNSFLVQIEEENMQWLEKVAVSWVLRI